VVEVALGNTIVAGATMHKFPLDIAFTGDQSYNVPQYCIGLAFHKSNTKFVSAYLSLFCFASFSFLVLKGSMNAKWLHGIDIGKCS
jgi:hypothetical protein